MLPARFQEEMLDLTLCVIRLFEPVDGNVMRNRAFSPPLTGFDVSAQ